MRPEFGFKCVQVCNIEHKACSHLQLLSHWRKEMAFIISFNVLISVNPGEMFQTNTTCIFCFYYWSDNKIGVADFRDLQPGRVLSTYNPHLQK